MPRYGTLYPQNDGRIVATDSVTPLHTICIRMRSKTDRWLAQSNIRKQKQNRNGIEKLKKQPRICSNKMTAVRVRARKRESKLYGPRDL